MSNYQPLRNQETVKITTPVVEANWCYLHEPDRKYNSSGEYKADLVLDISIPEHKQFMSSIKALLPVNSNTMPWKKDPNHQTKYIVRVKQSALKINGDNRYEFKPAIVDAACQPIELNEPLGNGSRVALNLEVRGYVGVAGRTGIRLNPEAVQVVEHVKYQKKASFQPQQAPQPQQQNNFQQQQPQQQPVDQGFQSQQPVDQGFQQQQPANQGFQSQQQPANQGFNQQQPANTFQQNGMANNHQDFQNQQINNMNNNADNGDF